MSSSSKRRREEAQPELQEAQEQLSQLEQNLAVLRRKHAEIERLQGTKRKILMLIGQELDQSPGISERAKFMERQEEKIEEEVALLPSLLQDMERTSSEIEQLKHRIEDLCRKTYFDYIIELGPPSAVEKEGLYKIQTREGGPFFHCCFPATAQPPLPLTLIHPVFGQFVDDFNNDVEPLDATICKFVEELCYEVLGGTTCATEADMKQAFNRLVSEFLECTLSSDDVRCTSKGVAREARTDGTARAVGGMWSMVQELKLEKGNTLAQGLQNFGVYAGSWQQKAGELLPCFYMEVVGPAIRIGALVYLEKVAWQPLTPFLNCFYREYDRTDMVTLCRAMRALKKGMAALGSHYKDSPPITRKDVPYSLRERNCLRIGKRLVFVVTLDDGHKRVFKYCRQYGNEVHQSWADARLAPVLHDCKPIAGGWWEVEMEYLEGWSSAFSLLQSLDDGDARAQLRAAISEALDQALAIKIEDCCVAHGDMRPPNIMVKRGEEGSFDVKFIDFDWAGRVDTTRYPPFMNQELPWAAGVGTGALLKQEHDKWLLLSSFDGR